MRKRRLFNDGWCFTKRALGSAYPTDGAGFSPVELPHDWLIDDARNLYETGEGWYRKSFEPGGIGDGHVHLRFEGVYMDCTVYINAVEAFEWKYGYSTFEFDMTPFLKPGVNDITVRVVFQAPNARWYSGAGIYRNVWLIRYPKRHIAPDGVYISPVRGADGVWTVDVDTELAGGDAGLELRHTILDAAGRAVCVGTGGAAQTLTPENPTVWDIDAPYLYTLRSELMEDGTAVDSVDTIFGLRTIAFDPENGFSLNGRRVRLYGVCQHHDLGALGAAVNRAALRRQLEILRDMGVNAIRTAHNMHAVELMALADEMGFLICSEAFDMWEHRKSEFDYARFFKDWAERDVAAWVRRDRNHPSVILWSIGNEVYDTHAGEHGQELTKMLMDYVREHDPKNHAPTTFGSNYLPWENTQKCADIIKIVGYNYAEKYYNQHHAEHPDWVIYGSETASTVQSRGIYHFPLSQSLLSDDDEQCSSLGNSSTSWGAKSTEACIFNDLDVPFSAGQFIWTGFDYIGEPTPYFTKNSYLGQIDTAGFPKDAFYIYKAAWTDHRKQPMVHIFPYWDFSEGQMIDVRVCSNAPAVELFFNGASLGRQELGYDKRRYIADYMLPYQKGALKAMAYDAAGAVIAQDIRASFGDAVRVHIEADKETVRADGRDLAFLTISTEDAIGRPVENANARVSVSVSGAGRLIGLDNGDSTDYDSYKGTSRRLFSGKLLAIVAPTYEAGPITVTVESTGLESATMTLEALPCTVEPGVSDTLAQNKPSMPNGEIPVRKIELVAQGGLELSPERRSVEIKALIRPGNATYRDLIWAVTNAAGIQSTAATIEARGDSAVVTALGDGAVWLRCMTKNGGDKISLIAQQRLTVSGLGEAYLNPYGFISGGLYTDTSVELTNGNDRGVATLRDGVSHVGFRDVDFGDYGSDTITLPLFPLQQEPFPLEIWEGMPGEAGSEHVCTVTYKSGMKWNTYQEETYKLPRRFKGVTTICFVLRMKVHIKGFYFEKQKAWARLAAGAHNDIYGDSFRLNGDCVEGIGNNVTLAFTDMDFSDRKVTGITIRGRTPLAGNTVHIRFVNEAGELAQMLDFPHAAEYMEHTFPIDIPAGSYEVRFIFLPGSDFDFAWFQFE
ncbi:MAG: DUF4982 domain-containing protein [Oscillospiraceae bacterium]|jgi:beta-galactosidase|nr:DUF4982 domain-containing protein [Oscillospiraceae bacterium]